MDTLSIIDSAFAQRLTITLLHFLWQALAAGLIVGVAAVVFRRSAARVRYLINTAAMLAMAACVPITFAVIAPVAGGLNAVNDSAAGSNRESTETAGLDNSVPPVPAANSWMAAEVRDGSRSSVSVVDPTSAQLPKASDEGSLAVSVLLRDFAPWITAIYSICVICLLARLLGGLWGGHKLRNTSTEIGDVDLIRRVARRAQDIGLRSTPVVAWCENISVPVVVGLIRPVILIPGALASGLSTDQLEAILTHELAHIRRYDPVVNLLQRLIEAVFFFHPVVWLISRQVSRERENACDDLVLEAGWRGVAYADALMRMAEFSQNLRDRPNGDTSAALAAKGRGTGEFKHRVLRLLQPKGVGTVRLTRSAVGIAVLMIVVLAGGFGLATARLQPSTGIESPAAGEVPTESEAASNDSKTPSVDATNQPPEAAKLESSLTGRVVDSAGIPIEGVMMIVRDNRSLFGLYGKGLIPTTDADGRFDLGPVEPGYRRVTAFSSDWALQTISVELPAVKPIQMTLEKGKRVEFRCVDVNGNPIPGIKFHPEAPRYTPFPMLHADNMDSKYLYVLDFLSHRYLIGNETNADGIFAWENAPHEALGYQIYGNGYLSHPGDDFGPDGSPHTLVFRKRISVAGSVVDAETGEPITKFRCFKGQHFKSNRPGTWSWEKGPLNNSVSVQDGGRFTDKLYNLSRVSRFRVEAEGYRPVLSEILDPETIRGDSATVQISLHKQGPVQATILTPDGKPAVAARVGIYQRQSGDYGLNVFNGTPDESQLAAVVETDSLGRVEIEPHTLPWLCFVWHDTGYQELADVEFLNRDAVTLKPWAIVSGKYELQQASIADVAVTLSRDNTANLFDSEEPGCRYQNSAVIDAGGNYGFPRCVAGEWKMAVRFDNSGSRPQSTGRRRYSLRLSPGQQLTKDIGRNGVDVIGRVSLPLGVDMDENRSRVSVTRRVETSQPLDRRQSLLRGSEWVFILTEPLQEDGSFRLPDLKPGEYELAIGITLNGEQLTGFGAETKINIDSSGGNSNNTVDVGEIAVQRIVQ